MAQIPPGMPPMPPQGDGGGPPMGGGIAQVLEQLMQNPQAIQGILGQLSQSPAAMMGMQNYLQGRHPTEGMPMPLPPEMLDRGPPPGPAGMGPKQSPSPPDENAPPQDSAEAMATSQIDNAGATFDGVDAPTQNDIDRLKEEPTDAMVEAFDAQFGDGAASKYLGGADPNEQSEPQAEEQTENPQQEQAEYDE